MRPLPELPISVIRIGEGAIHESLEVIDASIGGLALATEGSLVSARIGDRFSIRMSLAKYGEHQVDVVVRWSAPQQTGVELTDLGPEPTAAIRKYVAELLERGAPS
mgnify:CR=1 FL=1